MNVAGYLWCHHDLPVDKTGTDSHEKSNEQQGQFAYA
jgi:hypothetical protein